VRDQKFQVNEEFFQTLGQNREEAGEVIRDKLDALIDIENDDLALEIERQIRMLVDRMAQCHAVEAPYQDVFVTTIENYFKDLWEDVNFDIDHLLGLVGRNPVSKECFNLIVGLQRKHIQDAKAFPLKTTDVDDILSGKNITNLKLEAQKFNKILVSKIIVTKTQSHWLMFRINLNKNKKQNNIKCINPTRLGPLIVNKEEGKEFFDEMEKIALRLFPDKLEEKFNGKGT
jgi:hypothetical protein